MEISVIVPVYRVEKYLSDCIESILNQTFADFELILVDDGSPDRCGEICDEAAKHDTRVHVIHQKNAGLSAARNAGIEIARGSWLSFVDADDFVALNFLEALHKAATRAQADCAVCSFYLTDSTGARIEASYPVEVENSVRTGLSMLETLQEQLNVPYIVAWNKLYRRELFETLRYPVGRQNEDVFVFAELFDTAKTVACIADKLYFYRQHANSIMGSPVTLRNLDEMWGYESCFDYFAAHGLERLLPYAQKRMFGKLTGVYYRLPKKERRSAEMKSAKKALWHCTKELYQNWGFFGGGYDAWLKIVVFYSIPSLYEIRIKRFLRREKTRSPK